MQHSFPFLLSIVICDVRYTCITLCIYNNKDPSNIFYSITLELRASGVEIATGRFKFISVYCNNFTSIFKLPPNMLRTTALRAVRTASRASVSRAVLPPTYSAATRFTGIRFNSSQPESDEAAKAALKEARKLKDKLNHNWDAPILTYEQLKPKTASPSPVRSTTHPHSLTFDANSFWCIVRMHTSSTFENQTK